MVTEQCGYLALSEGISLQKAFVEENRCFANSNDTTVMISTQLLVNRLVCKLQHWVF